ncbi:MAG: ATP-binding protein, partial [Betaproteobacteria bacterium]|nr:ATP-binding protein [Betaproteobacteria bacterium]
MVEPFRRIQMAMELPQDTDVYLVDEVLIRNIVGNLLSNAIKYSPHGGQVTLRVTPRPGELVITVSDQGIGIPLADQPQLFESFHRASNVGNISGTGLGLAIVRDAVQCHGGSISLESTPGQGSTFTVVLTAPAAPKESAL